MNLGFEKTPIRKHYGHLLITMCFPHSSTPRENCQNINSFQYPREARHLFLAQKKGNNIPVGYIFNYFLSLESQWRKHCLAKYSTCAVEILMNNL